ncbi:MAG: Glutamine-dependent NAD(+) synthetase [Chlamydiae bacterium]|nr:Glutamine-dependent NAD(+) synthetase [Chlamydiota bacterium]
MRICMAQLNPIIGDLKGNTKKILEAIDVARAEKADIVLFSELTICGYAPGDLLLHDDFIEATEKCLGAIVKASSNICIIVGLVRHNTGPGKNLFNSAAIISDGQILGYYNKGLLPTYNVFDERRYFEPGRELKTFELKGKKIGIIICEDIWQHSGYVDMRYARDPIIDLVEHKPDILLNLSASPYQYDKPDVRVLVCAKAAKTLNCPVLLCCQVGGNDDLIFDGYSVCVDKHGNLRQLGKGFEEDIFTVDLEAPICNIPFEYNQLGDLYRALVLGVHDYFAKQNFKTALIGLSGGIDSALVACIAKDALGAENVLGISMPSRYSSEGSIEDAENLAKNLEIAFKKIPIEEPFKDYLKILEPHFEGKPPDVTEENLQARIRGMILMAVSNKLGYIVLSTGNKSEMGLGYCTLYGDMCGGLGVISDVLKTQVYDLCRWINRDREIVPWSTIEKPPSAELKPDQKDLDALPDYGIVDKVLKAYVEDHLSIDQITKQFQFDKGVVEDLVRRLHNAEYKRRQSAPGIRVSKVSFSVGRRFPIVQGWD